jgi:multiple sugar transport system ATP-binding protein
MNLIDGDMHLLGIRPEHVYLDPAAPLRGRVVSVESTGADRFLYCLTPRGEIVLRVPAGGPHPAAGEEIGIAYDRARTRRFDRATGKLLT